MGVAVKSVTVVPGNAARGLPSVHGALVLFDDATGRVEAVIDSGLVTKWKTAADSILGARLLARPDARPAADPRGRHGRRVAGRGLPRRLSRASTSTIWNRTPDRAAGAGGGDRRRGGRRTSPRRSRAADIVADGDDVARRRCCEGAWLRPGPASRPDRRLHGRHARGRRRLPAPRADFRRQLRDDARAYRRAAATRWPAA